MPKQELRHQGKIYDRRTKGQTRKRDGLLVLLLLIFAGGGGSLLVFLLKSMMGVS